LVCRFVHHHVAGTLACTASCASPGHEFSSPSSPHLESWREGRAGARRKSFDLALPESGRYVDVVLARILDRHDGFVCCRFSGSRPAYSVVVFPEPCLPSRADSRVACGSCSSMSVSIGGNHAERPSRAACLHCPRYAAQPVPRARKDGGHADSRPPPLNLQVIRPVLRQVRFVGDCRVFLPDVYECARDTNGATSLFLTGNTLAQYSVTGSGSDYGDSRTLLRVCPMPVLLTVPLSTALIMGRMIGRVVITVEQVPSQAGPAPVGQNRGLVAALYGLHRVTRPPA